MGRFSQAISEGDGISVIPVLEQGDIGALAAAADAAGAEAIAVRSVTDVTEARSRTDLPIIVLELVRDSGGLHAAREGGADACILVWEELAGEKEWLEELHAEALELGLDCALDVHDEDELEAALDRVDPEILIISERDPEKDEEELDRTFELLPDVPAGKLVVSDGRVREREQVLALERAGVDAVLLGAMLPAQEFGEVLAELTGR